MALEVMPDHVHLFVKHDPKSSASYVANQFKGFTSRVLREEFPHPRSKLPTLWSSSYFAASVGAVSAGTVRRYIDTQWERPWKKGDGSAMRYALRLPRKASGSTVSSPDRLRTVSGWEMSVALRPIALAMPPLVWLPLVQGARRVEGRTAHPVVEVVGAYRYAVAHELPR